MDSASEIDGDGQVGRMRYGGVTGHRRERQVTLVALLLSALVHLVALLLYPLLMGPVPEAGVGEVAFVLPPSGMEVVRIDEVSAAEVGAVVEPGPEIRQPDVPQPPAVENLVEDDDLEPDFIGPLPTRARTPAEELRPRPGDPRLWEPLSDSVTQVSDEWLARLRIIWLIEELNDSTTRAAMAAAAGQDWTFTDDDGKRWGISEGQLHLGDVTLPLPMFSAGWGTAAYQRATEDAEIIRGALQSATWETLQERARAIQERRDRERDQARADTVEVGGEENGP
jgi:hypothetical protein